MHWAKKMVADNLSPFLTTQPFQSEEELPLGTGEYKLHLPFCLIAWSRFSLLV
jgi:hypothetical protein